VNVRAVPGHWEGDLIIGKGDASAVGTLVERTTRCVLLLHLPIDHGAVAVVKAMRKAFPTLPSELVRSITSDQGSEVARHVEFNVATGVPIYFCDPHSPWQRGSNENSNGLLRQYMPKSTDRSKYSADDLLQIQRSLNGRPRKPLGYRISVEKLTELIALSTRIRPFISSCLILGLGICSNAFYQFRSRMRGDNPLAVRYKFLASHPDILLIASSTAGSS